MDPRESFVSGSTITATAGSRWNWKRKVREKTQKLSCPITKEQCEMLMRGEIPDIGKDAPPVLQKLCLLMRTRLLRPKVIVEYDRVPYIYPQGNVRITLDENIRSSSRSSCFWKIRFRPDRSCRRDSIFWK